MEGQKTLQNKMCLRNPNDFIMSYDPQQVCVDKKGPKYRLPNIDLVP